MTELKTYPWLPSTSSKLNRPCVVGTVGTDEGFRALSSATPPCDVVELRYDLLELEAGAVFACTRVLQERGKGVIFTARLADEGGRWKKDNRQRADLLLEALNHVSLVDIEAASPFAEEMIAAVEASSAMLILSSHDFDATPDVNTLKDRCRWDVKSDQVVNKVATRLNEPSDLDILKDYITQADDRWVSAMGMGPMGPQSRIELGRLGSCLNYGFLDAPAAPGQLSCQDLLSAFLSP